MAERTGETTDTSDSKQPSVKRAGTILVSDVTSELSKNDIWIYFQKKKNSGGEVLDVLMKMDSWEALVYFEDCKVAEAVAKRQGYVIKGQAVNVKLCDAVAEDKKRRTVLVSGFRTGTTKESITIHFQRKKNGGGEVEDVEISETGKALVVFEDLEVAEAIINKKQTFTGGEILTLRSMATELDLIKAIKQGDIDIVGKEERTILVSELPEGIPKNTIHIHFQRKKNNGGEVEATVLLQEGKQAWVIFEDPRVAEKVVDIEQIIQGKRVRVERLKTETKATERSVESATILVSGLPEGVTENRITMHFQKRRNGGEGEVKKVQLSSDRKEATVTFDDPKVAKKVVDTEQIIQGKRVRVELLKTETKATERSVESATILVSGLSEGVTENRITMHFQKRKNGGEGEVKKVQLSSDRKEATVTFDDPKVAEKVVDIEQIIQGKRVRVELLKTETQATERSVESATILVSRLPEGVTENRITMHFQNKENGGGDVKKVQLLSDRKEATVTFDDPKVAKTAVSTRHEIQRTPVTVILLDNDEEELVKETPPEVVANPEMTRTSEVGTPPEVATPEGMKTPTSEVQPPGVTTPTKVFETKGNLSEAKAEETMPHKISPCLLLSQEVDHVFSVVSATVNPALMNTVSPPASENFWSDVFNVITQSCGVHCQPSAYGVMLSGRLSQVVSAGEILKLKWRSHCQLRNVDYYNVFNQAGTAMNQAGKTLSQHGMTMNQAGTAIEIRRQELMSSEQNMNCSSDPRNQQPKKNDSEQWSNETKRKWEDNKTRDPGNASYNQHPHSDSDRRYDQTSDSKQPSIMEDTANSQPFGNPPNTPPGYAAQSPCGDETDPTRNHQTFENPSPPGDMDASSNSNIMKGDEASGSKTDSFSAKPATSLYSTGNLRPLDNTHNRTTGTENTTLNVDSTSPPGNSKVTGMPERSINDTTCSQPAENHQQSTTSNSSAGPKSSTTSSNQSLSLSKTDPRGKRPPISPSSTTNHQTPVKKQQSTSPNSSMGPESLITPSNQFIPLSNDKTEPRIERPPTSPHSTTNHQLPVNHQESSIPNTATGAEELTTSRNLLGLVSNGQPESRSEKPPGLSETNINPSPQVDEQQGTTTDPTTGPQNSTNSSNKVGSPANDQPDANSEKPPPDSTTNHHPPRNGQKSTAKNPTIGSPNSATSDNQTEIPSTNTSHSLGKNTSNPIEKTPSNQPQNNQQQTTPNQISKQTSTHEHPNNDTLPNNSPNLKEQTENLNDKPLKRIAPVPTPRQNKPGPRQNAAKFSTPAAKPQQPRQGSPSPTTEPNKNCVNDKPTTVVEPNKEGDQAATTENSKASIITDEQSDNTLDELD